jgi:trehalose synthase
MRRIQLDPPFTLDDHAVVAEHAATVRTLRERGKAVAERFRGRTLWMVNSTERGGGVAEILPALVALLRDLGIRTEWLVLEADDPGFFALTKRLHNLIHGEGDPDLTDADRALFEATNRGNEEAALERIADGDIVAIHDPQPMPLAGMLRERRNIRTIWRCHIGLDEENDATRAAWRFLRPYGSDYDVSMFSAPDYIPDFLEKNVHVVHPAIDPLTAKNRHLGLHHTVQILVNSGLLAAPGPMVTEDWEHRAERLQPDGSFAPATAPEGLGLLTRPIITQVSRWDRLKGFLPLMQGFTILQRRVASEPHLREGTGGRRRELVRLVLAGPDPASIEDDPEGREVLDELRAAYVALDAEAQRDIVLVSLPMQRSEQNALMVNALHRVSTIVAQNSLREGFGLTITEAMWKRIPIFSNARACGPRQQVRDGVEGRMIRDPEDPGEIAAVLLEMLCDTNGLERWARAAQHRAHEHFLIFGQVEEWLDRITELTP